MLIGAIVYDFIQRFCYFLCCLRQFVRDDDTLTIPNLQKSRIKYSVDILTYYHILSIIIIS